MLAVRVRHPLNQRGGGLNRILDSPIAHSKHSLGGTIMNNILNLIRIIYKEQVDLFRYMATFEIEMN